LRILKKIEKLGVNINWLIMGQGEMFSTVREIPRYKMSILLEDSHEKIKIPLGDMYKHNFTNLSELSNDIFIKLKLWGYDGRLEKRTLSTNECLSKGIN